MSLILKEFYDYDLESLTRFFFDTLSSSGKFINSKKILLKPNLLQASPPDRAITTHPVFVEAAILAIKEIDSEAEIYLGDSPGANFINYENVLRKTEILEVIKKYNINLVRIEEFHPKKYGDIILSSIIEKVDCIINLAKLKTHSLTGLTLAVKNLFGLVPGNSKVKYHKDFPKNTDLGINIAKIYDYLKDKTISYIDGIVAHEGEGPSRGTPVKLGLVGYSEDAVFLDFAITKILGLPLDFCKTNIYFLNKVNHFDESAIQNIQKRRIKVPISTKVDFLPVWLKRFVASRIKVKPKIIKSNCIKCYLCYKSCPVKAIQIEDDKYPVIEENKCIECYCCYEVCESDAIELKRSLLHRIYVR
ncbi:DUF362 domain-containing protein [Deferribacter thermophilus]|uniref:DUF362 domain-containing protein n=1 Tax=Deferribacter thermophilus TaxID=53573 RepID=UPI003C171679